MDPANQIEITPGPEQTRLDPQTATAMATLIEQNENLKIAMRRIVLHLSLLQVMSAKRIAEESLEGL